jgi:mannobiose 2-epimerase
MRRILSNILIGLPVILLIPGCRPSSTADNPDLEAVFLKSLKEGILNVWYPTSVDTENGGFLTDFAYDWKPDGEQNKMLVSQARHLWTLSKAAAFFNDEGYARLAAYASDFLCQSMWDSIYGGFYMVRLPVVDSSVPPGYNDKTAYGNSFAIYGLAAYFALSGDSSALAKAISTFQWLEDHSHDPEEGGYFDLLLQDGTWSFLSDTCVQSRPDRSAWKDQNSSIHLLEAFTELYKVWPDSLLRIRLEEMHRLIQDTIAGSKAYLTLHLTRDWIPVSYRDSTDEIRKMEHYFDHVSFGHDVETAFLLLESRYALGMHDTATMIKAKQMVDLALETGWDKRAGGFFNEGYYLPDHKNIEITEKTKVWWVQAEGLNSLLLMSKLFPSEEKYYKAFLKQWEYISTYQIDHEYGGWYSRGIDENDSYRYDPKASEWKANYHNARTLMNCIHFLRGEHELLKLSESD